MFTPYREEELPQEKTFNYKATRRHLKQILDSRLGQGAVYECNNILEEMLEKLGNTAEDILREENQLREKQGIPPRKTLQKIDFIKAKKQVYGGETG